MSYLNFVAKNFYYSCVHLLEKNYFSVLSKNFLYFFVKFADLSRRRISADGMCCSFVHELHLGRYFSYRYLVYLWFLILFSLSRFIPNFTSSSMYQQVSLNFCQNENRFLIYENHFGLTL